MSTRVLARGQRFLHRHYVTTAEDQPRSPETCEITRATQATVWFRVGPDGPRRRIARDRFEDTCVLSWIENGA